MLDRDQWHGFARKLDWDFSYVREDGVFPRAASGTAATPFPRVHVPAEPRDGGRLLSVRDNGGLDDAFADRNFFLCKRLRNRVKYPGDAIGLAICKKSVGRHGGRIWIESEPRKGAAFCFTMPMQGKGPS